jgi:magnesium transporter
MPELHWLFGYPFALLLMVAAGALMYGIFKKKGWL